MRTLIGGVGARDQSDHAIGPLVSDRLTHDAPIVAAHVVVEDLSSDPAVVAQRLNEEWPRFERVIFVGAVARSRPAGTVDAYRWDGELPSDDRVQTAFDGAHAGLVSLENTLLVLKQLGDLPDEVIVVEVEPEVARASGNDELSPVVTAALARAHARAALRYKQSCGRRASSNGVRRCCARSPRRSRLNRLYRAELAPRVPGTSASVTVTPLVRMLQKSSTAPF